MTVETGQDAPDFELKDHAGDAVTLSSFRGRSAVALVFFPFAFTGVCEGELCHLRDDHADFDAAGVQVLAISCDPRPALGRWAEEIGVPYPLLSDFWPHGEVARAYGVFNEALGCANRVTILVDADGLVVDRFESAGLGEPRDAARYRAAFAALG
ncbi:peroxiredoxin [Actinomarinicola tropica]|uniref:Alkyl hydroperoxide reductase E n=1 Tax=Actinomarinicola tropica TaxID=2789776 RepID=A0A5Q2RK37_9ACTN|nr:peroxiredoxin [Actinomarinicola tropica]QGG94931.1 redoxin domain-containing protein [Actinomarinicola tropica]